MKKILAITLTLASLAFTGFGKSHAIAATNVTNESNAIEPQWRNRNWRRNNRSRVRTYQTTRIVRYGYRTYRETILVRYLPNGRTQTTLISRQRIA